MFTDFFARFFCDDNEPFTETDEVEGLSQNLWRTCHLIRAAPPPTFCCRRRPPFTAARHFPRQAGELPQGEGLGNFRRAEGFPFGGWKAASSLLAVERSETDEVERVSSHFRQTSHLIHRKRSPFPLGGRLCLPLAAGKHVHLIRRPKPKRIGSSAGCTMCTAAYRRARRRPRV